MIINITSPPHFSIIIPVYNTAEYLEKCINSILLQTFTSWELLLIDDGSTDTSLRICKKFEKKYNNIFVYSQKNKGVSSARNLGIEKAKGKYLCFVDSDDWVDKDYLENFIGHTEYNSMIVQDHKRILENGKRIIRYVSKYNNEIFQLPKELSQLIKKDEFTQGYICGKLFSRNLILDNNLRFLEKVSLAEDQIFYYKYLQLIAKITFIKSDAYNYIDRENSLTSNYPNPTSWLIYIFECNKFYNYILKNDYSEENKKYFRNKFSHNVNHLLRKIIYNNKKYSKKERISVLKNLHSTNIEYLKYLKGDTFLQKIYYFVFKAKLFTLLDIILTLKTKYN